MLAAHVPLQMTHILKHKLTKVALSCVFSDESQY